MNVAKYPKSPAIQVALSRAFRALMSLDMCCSYPRRRRGRARAYRGLRSRRVDSRSTQDEVRAGARHRVPPADLAAGVVAVRDPDDEVARAWVETVRVVDVRAHIERAVRAVDHDFPR